MTKIKLRLAEKLFYTLLKLSDGWNNEVTYYNFIKKAGILALRIYHYEASEATFRIGSKISYTLYTEKCINDSLNTDILEIDLYKKACKTLIKRLF